MRMRIQDLSGWLDLTYRRPKIDDLWSSSDDGSRVSQPSAQVRTLLPPIFNLLLATGPRSSRKQGLHTRLSLGSQHAYPGT